jgi:hypothetical protein
VWGSGICRLITDQLQLWESMDTATTNAIIAAAAGFSGALIGAAASLGGGYFARRDEARTRRQSAELQHNASLASQCDELMRELASLTTSLFKNSSGDDESRSARDRRWIAFDELEMLATGLPKLFQSRIAVYTNYMRFVDEIGSDSYGGGQHYRPVSVLAREVAREAHRTLIALARGEKALPDESDLMIEIHDAFEANLEVREIEYAPEEAEFQDQREQWLKEHPKAGAALEGRRSSG